MRPFSDLTSDYSARMSPDVVETQGDESLICDARGRMRPAEAVQQKMQNALQSIDDQFSRRSARVSPR